MAQARRIRWRPTTAAAPPSLSLEARRHDGGPPQQWPGAEGGFGRDGERRSGGARGLLPTVTAVVRMAVDPGPIRVGYGLFFLSFSFFLFLLTVTGIKPPR